MKKLLFILTTLVCTAHPITRPSYAHLRNGALGGAALAALTTAGIHYGKYRPSDRIRRRLARQLVLQKFVDRTARIRHLKRMKEINRNAQWWKHVRNGAGISAVGLTSAAGYAAHKDAMERLRAELTRNAS